MAKKQSAKPTIFKKPLGRRPRTRTTKLSDGTVLELDDNNKKYAAKKNVFVKSADEEDTLPKPKDAASKHKYPPPKKNKIFRDKWMSFINLVVERESFKEAHLSTLEILCDLYVELAALDKFLRENGMTYEVITIGGKDRKKHIEVGMRTEVRNQIRDFTTRLDLFPKKDNKQGGGSSDGESKNWT